MARLFGIFINSNYFLVQTISFSNTISNHIDYPDDAPKMRIPHGFKDDLLEFFIR